MVCPVLKPSLQGVSRVLKIHVEILTFYVAVAHTFLLIGAGRGPWLHSRINLRHTSSMIVSDITFLGRKDSRKESIYLCNIAGV